MALTQAEGGFRGLVKEEDTMKLPTQCRGVNRFRAGDPPSRGHEVPRGIEAQSCKSCYDACATLASGWRKIGCRLNCRATECDIPQTG